jgi:PAS domain S-box-containing protein
MTNAEIVAERDLMSLLHEVSVALNANLDLDSILATAIEFADRLGTDSCEIHLLADSGELYFKNSHPERNKLTRTELQALVRTTLSEGVAAWVLQNDHGALVLDTRNDPRWLSTSSLFQVSQNQVCSLICAPITVGVNQLRGVIAIAHPQANYFSEPDLALLQAIATQIAIALKHTILLDELQISLRETHLILDISRRLAGALNLTDVYTALIQTIIATGADRCALHLCDELDGNNLPTRSEIMAVGDVDETQRNGDIDYRFALADYPILEDLVRSQETLIVENVALDECLAVEEQEFLQKFGACSLVIIPLVSRGHVIGFISIEYRTKHTFSERELALHRTLCNQTTIAIEHARQVQRTEAALSETQTLYRAGRVLAGAADLQEILQEALIEYVYSLGLDQGGVTLITPDRQYGQLMAYVQEGQLQNVEKLKFPLDKNVSYQQALLSGRPFVSIDAPSDPNLVGFYSFNKKGMPKSLLEAPMIIRGETIGWIGADSVKEYRNFSQQEIDLARAMADQIAITIQNRRLLEQTERRANRLKAAARVGESVSRMLDLGEIFNTTVELIRDRFGFYHVSIFLLDEVHEWAIVRASTGAVGKIMIETPHRLKVGSNSIVGYVTAKAQPRIALDVGGDAVHFQNPLLPDTRSELALPLLSRGLVIGALDVQSTEVNAFSDEDVDTLQIMADQLANAIENARLLQNAQDSRLFMKSIIDQIPDPIFIKDKDYRWVVVNRAFAEGLLGVPEDKVIGQTDYDYLPHDEANWFWAQDIKLFETGQTQETEQKVTNTEGNTRILYTRKVPLLDADGKPEYLIGISNDITERKQSEEALAKRAIELEESQNFLNSIIDNIPTPIFVKDVTNLRFARWNRASETLFGLSQPDVLGKNDYDLFSKEEADFFTAKDRDVLNSGQLLDIPEEPIHTQEGVRLLHTRKVPVPGVDGQPKYLLGISEDITERKQAEAALQISLARTQSLYRISGALATTTDQRAAAEIVLGEYLRLLSLTEGAILLLDKTGYTHETQALYVDGQAIEPDLTIPAEEDTILQHLRQDQSPLIISDTHEHPLTRNMLNFFGGVKAMQVIPLVLRDKVAGVITAGSTEQGYIFSENNIEIGEAIADQLAIWLENRQLLNEAQYRSQRLQTAAKVSQAANSILDVTELINTSVNLIRDQFDFYYVGLFMVDDAGELAVLRAGTGEAGRIQLANEHKLKIGGESMIGWSIQNRQARIALDVGQEAVHFQNRYLPDTHSEMALPLIHRHKVIGALTVQSTERGAFSAEDITLLQTMADQLANALENAILFEQTQTALAETENLYRITQELLSARDEETIYKLAIEAIAQSGADSASVYIYLDRQEAESAGQILEQKLVWAAPNFSTLPNGARFNASDMVIENLIPQQGLLLIEDANADEPYLTEQLRRELAQMDIKSLVALPLSTYQRRLGFLLVTYRTKNKIFSQQQLRFYNTIAQQMVASLENLRLLDASQRRAWREEIIREITGKIRNATNVEDILQTTVTELGKVMGASRGGVTLGVKSSSLAKLPASGESQNRLANSNSARAEKVKLGADRKGKQHGQ